jgi:hypothetical protein
MPLSSVRSWPWLVALLCTGTASVGTQQQAPPDTIASTSAPTRDPVTVRGCLEGRWLRILERDASDLSGVHRVRLKGSRSMLRLLDDHRTDYVEVIGDLDLGHGDRLDARRKKTIGRTTIAIGATAEQVRGGAGEAIPDPTLVVGTFTPLGRRCPKN